MVRCLPLFDLPSVTRKTILLALTRRPLGRENNQVISYSQFEKLKWYLRRHLWEDARYMIISHTSFVMDKILIWGRERVRDSELNVSAARVVHFTLFFLLLFFSTKKLVCLFILKEVKPSPEGKMIKLLTFDNLFPPLSSLILRCPRSFAVPFASLLREAKGTANDLGHSRKNSSVEWRRLSRFSRVRYWTSQAEQK